MVYSLELRRRLVQRCGNATSLHLPRLPRRPCGLAADYRPDASEDGLSPCCRQSLR